MTTALEIIAAILIAYGAIALLAPREHDEDWRLPEHEPDDARPPEPEPSDDPNYWRPM